MEVKGKRYTASTTIPPPVKFDKLWFELAPSKDSLGYVYGQLTDDAEEANYYRVFTQRLNKDSRFFPVYLSAMADENFNGKQFTFNDFSRPGGFYQYHRRPLFQTRRQCAGEALLDGQGPLRFLEHHRRELYVVGNPFSSSGNEIISNIDGDNALGAWGGYGVSYYAIKIK